MKASDIREKLNEALKIDSSGRTTPMMRMQPVLLSMVEWMEEHEQVSSEALTQAVPAETKNGRGSASKATA